MANISHKKRSLNNKKDLILYHPKIFAKNHKKFVKYVCFHLPCNKNL